jgi:serine/threonine protein kinase
MAPEQIKGRPRVASDQYSLGIIVYEWLSGERPFQGTFLEIANQHIFVPPPSLQSKIPSISPAIEEVVMTALAKDPQKRFPTVKAFASALEAAYHPGPAHQLLSSNDTFLLGRSSLSTYEIPLPSQPSYSTDVVSLSNPTSPIPATHSPTGESLQSTFIHSPLIQSSRPTLILPQQKQHRVSRRSVVVVLVGLAALGLVGGGTALLVHSSGSSTIVLTPTATSGVSAQTGRPTAAPDPTQKPTSTPTSTATPTNTPTPSPTPTNTSTHSQLATTYNGTYTNTHENPNQVFPLALSSITEDSQGVIQGNGTFDHHPGTFGGNITSNGNITFTIAGNGLSPTDFAGRLFPDGHLEGQWKNEANSSLIYGVWRVS